MQKIICRLDLTSFRSIAGVKLYSQHPLEVLLNTSIYSRSKQILISSLNKSAVFFKTWFEIRMQKDCSHFIETPDKRCIMGKRAGYSTSLKHETYLSFCLLTWLLFCRLLSLFSFRRLSKMQIPSKFIEQISFSRKS